MCVLLGLNFWRLKVCGVLVSSPQINPIIDPSQASHLRDMKCFCLREMFKSKDHLTKLP